MTKIGATLLFVTITAVIGLIVLNPTFFTDSLTLATSTVQRSFRFATGGGSAAG